MNSLAFSPLEFTTLINRHEQTLIRIGTLTVARVTAYQSVVDDEVLALVREADVLLEAMIARARPLLAEVA